MSEYTLEQWQRAARRLARVADYLCYKLDDGERPAPCKQCPMQSGTELACDNVSGRLHWALTAEAVPDHD